LQNKIRFVYICPVVFCNRSNIHEKFRLMERGYLIENYAVTDKENYVPPVKIINKVLERFNGKFLVATPKSETLSGIPLEVIIGHLY